MAATLEQQVIALLRTYGRNPQALLVATKALIEGLVEQANKEGEKELATRKCLHLHPVASDNVMCAECAKSEQWLEHCKKERREAERDGE